MSIREVGGVLLLLLGALLPATAVFALLDGQLYSTIISIVLGSLLIWGGIRVSRRWRLILGLISLLAGVGMLGALGTVPTVWRQAQAIPTMGLGFVYLAIGVALLVSARAMAKRLSQQT